MSDKSNSFSIATPSWRGDIPVSQEYGDVYFSLVDGLEESQYVFIDSNDLPARFSSDAVEKSDHNTPFVVAEAGFGSGLNFLLTWKNWLKVDQKDRRPLHFISYEKHPLTRSDLEKSLSKWPALRSFSCQLVKKYPFTIAGQHNLEFESGRVKLSLVFGDIADTLPLYRFKADCWYLDGFSPNKNPEMWTPQLFEKVARLSHLNATFSTFAAASIVRKGLEAAGFEVKRKSGFGKKREMLLGHLSSRIPCKSTPKTTEYNWSLEAENDQLQPDPHQQSKPQFDVIVIGAGLAGLTSAAALSKQNLKVALLDEKEEPAAGASGQSQLVMYAKFPSERNKLFTFVEHCLNNSLQYYQSIQESSKQLKFWHPCGVLQLAWNEKEAEKQARFSANIKQLPGDFVRSIDENEASSYAGFNLKTGGLWFEKAGWLDPKMYAAYLLNSNKIECFYKQQVCELSQAPDKTWLVTTKHHQFTANNVVVCTSNNSTELSQLSHLPIKPLRGQVTSIRNKNNIQAQEAKCVLTGEGYLCPPVEGWHHFGATFNLDSVDTCTNLKDNEKNFLAIQNWNPTWLATTDSPSTLCDFDLTSKAGLRCTTPDYIPIVGQAPVFDEMLATFAKLRVGANSCKHLYGHYYEGLYLNIGHGSKGLFTTPIAAELITQEICGGAPPVNENLRTMLSPARFIIKHLKQRRL